MDKGGYADLVVVNARVISLARAVSQADTIAARDGRILASGLYADLRHMVGPSTEFIDADGGLAVAAFHDAHLHLLSYARQHARINCHACRTIAQLQRVLARESQRRQEVTVLRAGGYDEMLLADGRHPNRRDLDAAVPARPLRLQDRTLHVDVLNSEAMRLTGLSATLDSRVERDPVSGELTGRIFHGADLLKNRWPRPSPADLAASVRVACQQLLSWGVTTVQDASVTNGLEEWELFRRLHTAGDLPLRVVMFRGAAHWREFASRTLPCENLHVGPIKFWIDEATTDSARLRHAVAEVRSERNAVAFHAVTEADLAIAIDALSAAPRAGGTPPDRIEHGAVIPDAYLAELRSLQVTVVGQPTLPCDRMDFYRATHPPEVHHWLHRARSLLKARVRFAVGSDAPISSPSPYLGLAALQRPADEPVESRPIQESLGPIQALRALTLAPSMAVALGHELGRVRPGFKADLAVIDPEVIEGAPGNPCRQARFTVLDGRLVWRREG